MPANKDGFRPVPRRHQHMSALYNLERRLGMDSDGDEEVYEEPFVVDAKQLVSFVGTLADAFHSAVNYCLQELDVIQKGGIHNSEVDTKQNFVAAGVPTDIVYTFPLNATSETDKVTVNVTIESVVTKGDKVNVEHPIENEIHEKEDTSLP